VTATIDGPHGGSTAPLAVSTEYTILKDKKWVRVDIKVKNTHAERKIKDVRYAHTFDPDDTKDDNGEYVTDLKRGFGSYETAPTETFQLVSATSRHHDAYENGTHRTVSSLYYSEDSRAKATFGWSGPAPEHGVGDWAFTEYINHLGVSDLYLPRGAHTTADSWIGIVFKFGNLKPGKEKRGFFFMLFNETNMDAAVAELHEYSKPRGTCDKITCSSFCKVTREGDDLPVACELSDCTVDECCTDAQTCEGYNCKPSFILKMDPAKHKCVGANCRDTDNEQCCDKECSELDEDLCAEATAETRESNPCIYIESAGTCADDCKNFKTEAECHGNRTLLGAEIHYCYFAKDAAVHDGKCKAKDTCQGFFDDRKQTCSGDTVPKAHLPSFCATHTCVNTDCCGARPACKESDCEEGHFIKHNAALVKCGLTVCSDAECCDDVSAVTVDDIYRLRNATKEAGGIIDHIKSDTEKAKDRLARATLGGHD
jgi:hypothetical protein